jgi:hypothetical protein
MANGLAEPKTDVQVKLIGEDGNAFAIMARVERALKKAGHGDLVQEYLQEATNGDFHHLLMTTLQYVQVEMVEMNDQPERKPMTGKSTQASQQNS